MTKGVSIHIGVNFVDTEHYGAPHKLPYCVNDALAMRDIAASRGFETHLLCDEEATSHNFFFLLRLAASGLLAGDILFISLSGHGSFFKDINGDEDDGYDEAFMFFDRFVIDDEFYLEWHRFQPGVRVLFISDSCYCGTLSKDPVSFLPSFFQRRTDDAGQQGFLGEVYEKNKWSYDALFKNIIATPLTDLGCTVLLLAACQDDQTAGAGVNSQARLSAFTEILVGCWADGRFNGSYADFHALAAKRLKEKKITQRPNYYLVGNKNSPFQNERPFTI